MEITIPRSLTDEHEELHAGLAGAFRAGGRKAEAARRLLEVLHPHLVKEEEIAMPLLGLLPRLAAGEVTPEMAELLGRADRLKEEFPRMLEEHVQIMAALEALAEAARLEGKPGHADFAERLVRHARAEEEILYPAAILAGEQVRHRLGR